MFLPTVTPNIPDVAHWKTLDGKPVTLNKKISILGFAGHKVLTRKGNYFNLNQKIYLKNKDFTDFQFVIIAPTGSEQNVRVLLNGLKSLSDTSKWLFVFAPQAEIEVFFSKLKLKGKLDADGGSNFVYIIDKKRNLRGRKDPKEYKEGYNAISPADVYNEMTDDVKVILAEYRLALKRNNADRQN
ncbi:MAG: hypothetical protein RLZ77_1969 [Bacteroidota bacterium]